MTLFKKQIITVLFCLLSSLLLRAEEHPKREFRGAWLQTIYQMQYQEFTPAEAQSYLRGVLDQLQATGINAVVFQCRPCADAFYASEIEPWSRFLTGKQGVAPSPLWDPLQFMIEECHARNMELHAWLNPYRVTASAGEVLSRNHIYYQHPEWFVMYGGKRYFDPGIPQSRQYICRVVADIVSRYDVDAIHMDDYFYPYPIAGKEFPDYKTFKTYGKGYSFNKLHDWRRENVNLLIEELHETITEIKPWVRLGISPFGIFRNKSSDPRGSDTNGTQTYDNLYADVLRWTEMGWVDYMIPQLYWEIGHQLACSSTLAQWWNKNSNERHLYIGQSVIRTMDAADLSPSSNQMDRKVVISRYLDNILGNCFWSGYDLIADYKGISSALKRIYFSSPALIPAYTHIDNEPPKGVRYLKDKWTPRGYELSWKRRNTSDEMQEQIYFCIYRFRKGEKIDISNATKLITTTRDTSYMLPYRGENREYIYVVTAVDRMHNESQEIEKEEVTL